MRGAGRGQGAGLLGKEVPPAGGPGEDGRLQVLYSRKQGFTVPAQPSPAPAVNSQQTGSHRGQNLRSASAVQAGLQPPGSKQGPRITTRALLRDFRPDLLLPWQRGGEPGPPGKPSTSTAEWRRRERSEGTGRPGARKQGFVVALPLHYLVCLPSLGLSIPICKRSRLYLMIRKGDSAVTSSFLRGPEPSWMAGLLSPGSSGSYLQCSSADTS